jgi:hypothetical protein
MARPQNSYRGRFSKQAIDFPASGGILFTDYSSSSNLITANSTGLVLAGGIRISSKANATLTGNTTGLVVAGAIRVSNKSTAVISGNSTGIVVNGAIRVSNKSTAVISGNSTGVLVNGKLRVSGVGYVGANSTGFIFTAASVKPTARSAAKWAFFTTSTGVNSLAINTTGTTWKYVTMTSVLNSAAGYP